MGRTTPTAVTAHCPTRLPSANPLRGSFTPLRSRRVRQQPVTTGTRPRGGTRRFQAHHLNGERHVRHGSHASLTGKLTSAAIDARDFLRARKDRETGAYLPEGTLVAVAGGKHVADPAVVVTRLDKAKAKYADIVLVHGGGPGVEKIAASWAERNAVHQIVCKPDWERHGRAAPFRRNDALLDLLPKGVIAFLGSGITDNLVDKARQLGIPVHRVAA